MVPGLPVKMAPYTCSPPPSLTLSYATVTPAQLHRLRIPSARLGVERDKGDDHTLPETQHRIELDTFDDLFLVVQMMPVELAQRHRYSRRKWR